MKYSDLPENRELLQPPPEGVEAQLKGNGFQILISKLFKPKITLHFDDFTPVRHTGTYYYLPNAHLSFFQKKYYKWEWMRFLQDSIVLYLGEKATRKVPVINQVRIQYKPGFQALTSIKIIPDSVSITGPLHWIEDIQSIPTIEEKWEGISENISRKVGLKLPENHKDKITLLPTEVNIQAEVVRFTEKQLLIPVHLPGKERYKIIPSGVKVVFQVPFDRYSKVSEKNISLTVSGYGGEQTKLPVIVAQKPEYIKILRILPDTVSVWRIHGGK